MTSDGARNAGFEGAVAGLREGRVVGASGRLRELFDYLADRGPEAEPATQAEIAAEVFGQAEPDADDATVRVYMHRLRKKIDDHYRDHPATDGATVLELPAGVYALRQVAPREAAVPPAVPAAERTRAGRNWPLLAAVATGAALMLTLAVLFLRGPATASNPIWDPLLASDRPVLVVLGDYYLFGEIDPVRPEEGRLIRDFRVDSPAELQAMQEADPEAFANAEDVGLNYLPFQSAYALQAVAPLLAATERDVQIIAASELTTDMLTGHDVVYVGLLSGMGILENIVFAGSGLRIGENYDELIDRESGQRWASDEARRLAAPVFYRDFAYIARFTAPGDALVTVVASERVTGLRGIGPGITGADLPEGLADVAGDGPFEALFQITGQQGADLSDRMLLARARR